MLRELRGVGARLRLRPRPGDPLEARILAAADQGRAGALARTSTRFGGLDVAALSQNLDGKPPLLLDVDPRLLDELDAPRAVDRCLRTMDARSGHSRLADGTRRPVIPEFDDVYWAAHGEAGTTTIRSFAVHEAVGRGITLVVNNLTPRLGGPLRDLINDLDRALGLDAQVNLYLSEREAPGFGRHWDDHDVIIVQTMGRKHWTLFEPTALSPRMAARPHSS